MPNIFPERTSRLFIILVDLLLVLLSYGLAFTIASHYRNITDRNIDSFVALVPWLLLMAVFFLYVFELDRLIQRDYFDLIRKLTVTVISLVIFTTAASFILREFALPRSVIGMSHVFMFVSMFSWKSLYMRLKARKLDSKAVFIGDEEEFHLIQENLLDSKLTSKDGVSWLKKDSSLKELKDRISPYSFIFIGSSMNEKKKNDILYYAMKQNKQAYMIPNTNELFVMKTSVTTVGDTMVMQVKPFTLTNGQILFKRLLDTVVSFILLVATLPVMLVTAFAIKLEDGGPVFFKQERIGKGQQPFKILKFRSMIVDAEAKTGPTLAKDVDDRITKIGKFIRKTRIDELPQLINVLKGDMSLVGPRPEREFFAKQFQNDNKWFYYRNSVKPGITGYAQVLGFYTTSPERKLKFDLYYIRHYSIWLDIVLLLKTVVVVLNKSQAEGNKEDKTTSNPKQIRFLKSKQNLN